MKKTLKTLLFSTLLFFSLSLGLSLPTFADGSDSICNNASIPQEVKNASGCSGGDDQLITVIQNILYAIIAVSGIVAVIYIIIGGINYMTSSGDTNKVQKARQTILYAVIGLIVCALAFVIVNFTVGRILS